LKRAEQFEIPSRSELTLDLQVPGGRVVVETTSEPHVEVRLMGAGDCAAEVAAAELRLRGDVLTVRVPDSAGAGNTGWSWFQGRRSPGSSDAGLAGTVVVGNGNVVDGSGNRVAGNGNVVAGNRVRVVGNGNRVVGAGVSGIDFGQPVTCVDRFRDLALAICVPAGTRVRASLGAATLIARGRYGRVDAASVSGAIQVAEATEADIQITSGGIVLTSVGTAVLRSVSGRFLVRGATGHVSATSVSGYMRLAGLEAGADVTSTSGACDLRVLGGSTRVSSLSGEVVVEVANAGPVEVVASSQTGPVDALPSTPGAATRVTATSVTGAVTVDRER
jgi:hypothetical protein